KGPGISLEGIPGVGAPAGGRGGFPGRGGGGGPARGPGRGGGAGAAATVVEVDSPHPKDDAARLLKNFMSAAYRRPVEDDDLRRFQALFDEQFAKGHGFARSMLAAYAAVLASPRFVFIDETPGKLDDMALATRLSLLLWNSTPDTTLRQLASAGDLHKPEVLR